MLSGTALFRIPDSVPAVIVSCTYLFFGALHLVLYAADRRAREHLAYAALLVCYVAILCTEEARLVAPQRFAAGNYIAMNALLLAESILTGVALEASLNLPRIKPFLCKSLGTLAVLCAAATAVGCISASIAVSRLLFYIPCAVGLAIFTGVLLRAVFRDGRRWPSGKKVLVAAFVLNVPFIMALALIYRNGLKITGLRLAHIGFLPLIAAFEFDLLSSFIRDMTRLAHEGAPRQGDRAEELARRYALTEREAEVAGLLLEGLEAKDIARKLGIAYNTARNLKQRVYEKTGTHGMAELMERCPGDPGK